MDDRKFMEKAISLGKLGLEKNGGGPFGAVVVKGNKIVGMGYNTVTSKNDPTAHAEINAIREACSNLKTFSLEGCVIYSTCEPCPMCLGAIYWAGIKKIIYGSNRHDAENAGFSDAIFHFEQSLPMEKRSVQAVQFMQDEAMRLFEIWRDKEDKIEY